MGRAVRIEVEELLVGPDIGAVLREEDRHIAHDADALLLCVIVQVLPLAVEDVLHELLQCDVFLQAALQRCDCRRLPFLDVLRPVHPALVVVFLLGCLKKRVIIEPVCLIAAEGFVVRLCCCIALESCMCLAQALVLEDARLLEVSRRIEVGIGDLGLLLAEPAPLDEHIDVDEQRVARKG